MSIGKYGLGLLALLTIACAGQPTQEPDVNLAPDVTGEDRALVSDALADTADTTLPEASQDATADGDVSMIIPDSLMQDASTDDSAAPTPRVDNVLYVSGESRLILYTNSVYIREQSHFFTKIFQTQRWQDSGVCTIAILEFSDGINYCRMTNLDGGMVSVGQGSPTYTGNYQFVGYHSDGGIPAPGGLVYALTLPTNPCFSTLSRLPMAVSITINTSSSGGSNGLSCRSDFTFADSWIWRDAMRVTVVAGS